MVTGIYEKERKDERKKKREEGTQPAAQDRKCEQPVCFCGADKGRKPGDHNAFYIDIIRRTPTGR